MVMSMRSLSSSSLIDLVATGSPVTLEQVEEAVKQVESLGFRARVPSISDLPFFVFNRTTFKGNSSTTFFFECYFLL